jgi:hypothetical protein
MKKLLLAFCIFSVGAVSFGTLRHATTQTRAAAAAQLADLAAAATHATQLQATIDSLRKEADEKQLVKRRTSQTVIRHDLLDLLENVNSKQPPATWTDLRRELGIGWDSSDEYVLVSKRVLTRIGLHAFSSPPRITDTVRAVLAISPAEESQIKAVVQALRDEQIIQARRLEPEGDILAHYVIPADDTNLEENISNRFAVGVTTALGRQRADVFLDTGWRELRSALPMVGTEAVTFTIRRPAADGEQKLTWQIEKGAAVTSGEVRYAHHPSMWFSRVFPRGWREVAERNGFELPDDFEKRNGR